MLNRIDVNRVERGYYEKLLNVGRRFDDLGDLPELRVRRRSGGTWSAPFDAAPLVTRVNDLREVAIKPNQSAEKWGVRWKSNRLGMRDGACEIPKPANCVRVALVGDSIAAGWGVNAEDGFESLLESRWNASKSVGGSERVEVVNCAVPGHSPGQRWDHFGRVGWQVDPDMVICEVTEADLDWDERRLRYLLPRGLGWDAPVFRDVLAAAALERDATPEEYKRILQPRQRQILAGVYGTMIADCRSRGIPILWVMIPRVGRQVDADVHEQLIELARQAGFDRVVDASDAYEGMDAAGLAVEADDFHPNARGHARLADRIDELLGGRAGVEGIMRSGGQDRPGPKGTAISDGTAMFDRATKGLPGGRGL